MRLDYDDTCAALRPARQHRSAAARIAHERRKRGLQGIRGGGVIAVAREAVPVDAGHLRQSWASQPQSPIEDVLAVIGEMRRRPP